MSAEEAKDTGRWPSVYRIALLAVVLRIGIAVGTHFTSEDFLITLRYAENLAGGLGFVYNAGERVLGTTTPLYTLFLALAAWLHFPAAELGKALNIVADGALCVVVYRWLSLTGYEPAGRLAALCIAINPLHVRWSVSGMETSLVALGGMTAWLLWTQRRYFAAYATLAVLFLLRWDSLLLTAVVTGAILWRERRVPWRELLLMAAITAPWVLWSWSYFGSAIPITAAAKLHVYGWHGANPLFPRSPGLLERLFGNPAAALTTLLALWGLTRVLQQKRRGLGAPLAWLAIYLAGLAATPVLLFEWYLVPPLAVYEALFAIGLMDLASRVLRSWSESGRRTAASMAAGVAVLALGARSAWLCAHGQAVEDRLRRPLGLWLREHAAPTDRVLLEPIGYIGYYSRLPVIDVIGLVSPEVLPYWKESSPDPVWDLARAFRPEWCILRPAEIAHIRGAAGSEWEREYELVQRFTYSRATEAPLEFQVYRRRGAG